MSFTAKILLVLFACIVLTVFNQIIRWRQAMELGSEDDPRRREGRGLGLNTKTSSRIIHVISLYKPNTCEEPYCPFNQAQSIVIESMIRAKKKSRSPVILAAATFPEDRTANPYHFMLLPSLKRDTLSEYPNVPYMKKMPFIQDIFDLVVNSNIKYDYVVYTNSDIILNEDFYNIVQDQIDQGYDAFTINRQTIPMRQYDRKYTSSDLEEIYQMEGHNHPGFDCFIFKKDVFAQIRMGDVFLGAPPVARALLAQMELKAQYTRKFLSNELKATYHLGSKRTLTVQEMENLFAQNAMNIFCTLPELINECILSDYKLCQGLLKVVRKRLDESITFEDRDHWCKGKLKSIPWQELT